MIGSARKVRKRDGREVPYDQGKIADVIFRAARSVGGGDRLLAEELSSVVTMFIEKEWGERIPSIEDVSDLIEKVLVETGHAHTAKAFILERDRRARIRAALRVRSDAKPAAIEAIEEGGTGPEVAARTSATITAWSKGKIVEALMVEGDLPPQEAEEIAAEVERRVFASGLTRISTQLIRALVDNELFERGHERILDRQAVIGLPRFDLDRLARNGVETAGAAPGSADAVDRVVAGSCWAQYSLASVFPQAVVEAHLAGQIHLGAIDAPTRFQALQVDVGDPRKIPALAAFPGLGPLEHLRLLTLRLADLASGDVVLGGVERLLAEPFASDAFDAEADAWARALLAALAAPRGMPLRGPETWLRFPLAAPRAFVDVVVGQGVEPGVARSRYVGAVHALLRQASALSEQLRCPRLLLEVADRAPDVPTLERIALAEEACGSAAVLVEPAIGGTLSPVVPTVARVDVNVAQAAFRARRFETSAVLDHVEAALRIAAEACEARFRWLAGLPGRASPRERLRALFPGITDLSALRFEIGLAGLDVACRVAFDKPLAADERACAFALSVKDGAARVVAEEAAARRLPLALAFTGDPAVLHRFGRVDFERFARGRDVHGVPHDGGRYLYRGTLGPDADEMDPDQAAAIEASLRRGTVPAPLPVYHSHASRRARFVGSYAERLHGDPAPCS